MCHDSSYKDPTYIEDAPHHQFSHRVSEPLLKSIKSVPLIGASWISLKANFPCRTLEVTIISSAPLFGCNKLG